MAAVYPAGPEPIIKILTFSVSMISDFMLLYTFFKSQNDIKKKPDKS